MGTMQGLPSFLIKAGTMPAAIEPGNDSKRRLLASVQASIECMRDFEYQRGQVLPLIFESAFIEYASANITAAAQHLPGGIDERMRLLRTETVPATIDSIFPTRNASPDAADGLWEHTLEQAYTAVYPAAGEINRDAFRSEYVFRLRNERARNSFRQKIERALWSVLRNIARDHRRRMMADTSQHKRRYRRTRRNQYLFERQIFYDHRLFSPDWRTRLSEVCAALEGHLPVPEAWRLRKHLASWNDVAALVDTDRSFRSRVQKYLQRRLHGAAAAANVDLGERTA